MSATQEQVKLLEDAREFLVNVCRTFMLTPLEEFLLVRIKALDALLREREELTERLRITPTAAHLMERQAWTEERFKLSQQLAEAQREIERITGEKEIVGALSVKRAEEKVVPYQHWKDLAENRLFRAEAAEARVAELEAQLQAEREMRCAHGWRGSVPEDGKRIVTPCPACGAQSLFIGTGGHLTCAALAEAAPAAGEHKHRWTDGCVECGALRPWVAPPATPEPEHDHGK